MTESANLPSVASVQCAFVPVCTRERFAQFSGLDEGVIRGMCDPTIKLDKYSMINLMPASTRRHCALARGDGDGHAH